MKNHWLELNERKKFVDDMFTSCNTYSSKYGWCYSCYSTNFGFSIPEGATIEGVKVHGENGIVISECDFGSVITTSTS